MREEVAVRQQYGGRHAKGGGGLFGMGAKPNAYMLVYARRDLLTAGAGDGSSAEPSAALLPDAVQRVFERTLKGAPPRARGAAAFESLAADAADSLWS